MDKRPDSSFSVLFVDDEANILSALRRMFRQEPYHCHYVSSGEEALNYMLLREVGVVVADMRMPGMDGLKLLSQVRELYPNTIRMVLSGYTQVPQILAVVNQVEIFKFIPKPWETEDDLLVVVREAVGLYSSYKEREKEHLKLEQTHDQLREVLKLAKEKLDLYLGDIAHLSSISATLLEQASRLICQVKPEDTDFVSRLWQAYIGSLPTRKILFNTQTLERELQFALSRPGKYIATVNVTSEDIELFGNYNLITALVRALVEMASGVPRQTVKLTVSVQRGAAVGGLVLTFGITDINPASAHLLMQASGLISEICSTLSGKFAYTQGSMTIAIPFPLTQE